MSASDHLHPSQSGPFKTFYHGGRTPEAPHTVSHPFRTSNQGNMHQDVVHAGTQQAVSEFNERPFIHEYEVDTSKMDPHVWGDDENVTYSPRREEQFNQRTKGLKLDETESTPMTGQQVADSGKTHAYRNMGEDAGNISVAFPKSAVESGAVRYKGTRAHPKILGAITTMVGGKFDWDSV